MNYKYLKPINFTYSCHSHTTMDLHGVTKKFNETRDIVPTLLNQNNSLAITDHKKVSLLEINFPKYSNLI